MQQPPDLDVNLSGYIDRYVPVSGGLVPVDYGDVYLKVWKQEPWAVSCSVSDGMAEVPLGERIVIELSDVAGASIRVGLDRSSRDQLALKVEPIYEDPDRWQCVLTREGISAEYSASVDEGRDLDSMLHKLDAEVKDLEKKPDTRNLGKGFSRAETLRQKNEAIAERKKEKERQEKKTAKLKPRGELDILASHLAKSLVLNYRVFIKIGGKEFDLIRNTL
jgi:hypothetical protein